MQLEVRVRTKNSGCAPGRQTWLEGANRTSDLPLMAPVGDFAAASVCLGVNGSAGSRGATAFRELPAAVRSSPEDAMSPPQVGLGETAL